MKPSRNGWIIIFVIIGLLILGGIGKVTTSGYHCHDIRVGDSIVCQ